MGCWECFRSKYQLFELEESWARNHWVKVWQEDPVHIFQLQKTFAKSDILQFFFLGCKIIQLHILSCCDDISFLGSFQLIVIWRFTYLGFYNAWSKNKLWRKSRFVCKTATQLARKMIMIFENWIVFLEAGGGRMGWVVWEMKSKKQKDF